jgi:hypothetical protein
MLLQLALDYPEAFPGDLAQDKDAWKPFALRVLSAEFLFHLQQTVGSELENREPRVRTCVVDLLEWLCKFQGVSVYEALGDDIITCVLRNFTRDFELDEPDGAESDPRMGPAASTGPATKPDAASVDGSSVVSWWSTRSEKTKVAHDTVGWRALESSIRAVRAPIAGCGREFITEGFFTEQLRDVIIPQAAAHPNRFVREAAMWLLCTIASVAQPEDLDSCGYDIPMCTFIGIGMEDSWSQVCEWA